MFHHCPAYPPTGHTTSSSKQATHSLGQHYVKLPFHGHYTGLPELASTPVKNLRILLEQSFTAHMPVLLATSTPHIQNRKKMLTFS